MRRLLSVLLAAMLLPSAAFAHPGHMEGGWSAGFAHPFLGWDHMVVMIAVGVWAARSGRAWIPPAFVGVMMAGAGAALAGVAVPGVEAAILASTLVVAALALWARTGVRVTLAVVSLFAFFHGFAHGVEAPGGGAAFMAGVVGASFVLHGIGFAAARAITLARGSGRESGRKRSLTS